MSDYTPTSIAAAVPAEAPKPRKKRRVFMWFFLAVQALFLAWIIVGTHNATSGVETQYQGAADLGATIGAGLVIGLWVAADVILGIGRLVVITARRRNG